MFSIAFFRTLSLTKAETEFDDVEGATNKN